MQRRLLLSLSIIALLLGFNFLNILTVKADTAKFYEAEYVDGIYIRYQGGGMIYYQKARFFRRSSDNMHAYCLEPFVKINESATYESQINPSTISQATWKKLSLIAHFGYNYKDHTSPKWYAITQVMIWKEVEPNANFVFTDTLNGNTINPYQNEIDEINSLIESYQNKPSFDNSNLELIEDEKSELIDKNNVLSNYKSDNNSVVISNNKLIIDGLKNGNYKINLTRDDKSSNTPPLFYYNSTSQKIMTSGYAEEIKSALNINVISTSITIEKRDYDTKSTTSTGDAILEGAQYELYDKDMNIITTLNIDKNFTSTYKNLALGKYYLKEVTAGVGYTVDPNTYEFTITKEKPNIVLTLENEVIKKKVTINKSYGNDDNFKGEENATFEIYDSNNNLVKTISTNSSGKAEVILPFGKYIFKQVKTKDGYDIVDDFNVNITEDNDKLVFDLFDYEIKVPNTQSNNKYFSIFTLMISILLGVSSNVKKFS